MTTNPYRPSCRSENTSFVRLTERESIQQRTFWSLGCSTVCGLAIVVMVCLVEWHDPENSQNLADYFPFWKVVVPLSIAGTAASMAVLFSVPVFLSGRITPAIWLGPMVVMALCFMTCYDWYGLFAYGKARSNWLANLIYFLWLIFIYYRVCVILIFVGLVAVLFRWLHWSDSHATAQREALLDQIISDEVAAGRAKRQTSRKSRW